MDSPGGDELILRYPSKRRWGDEFVGRDMGVEVAEVDDSGREYGSEDGVVVD